MDFCDYKKDFIYPELGTHMHLHNLDFPKIHIHNYWEFFIVTEGICTHVLNGEEIKTSKNNLFLIRPNDAHYFLPHFESKTQSLNVMMTDCLFKEIAETINQELYYNIINAKIPLRLFLSEEIMGTMLNLLHIRQTIPTKDIYAQNTLVKLMYMETLKTIYCNSLSSNTNYPDWLNDFIAKIRLPENIGLKVEDVYSLSNFSHNHITRLFKDYTGETIISYFKKIKIAHAAQMLQTSNFTVLAIALKIGYTSLSHFIRIFKETYHLSPSEYRKRARKGGF